ncbi:MAG: terpene synthase family protein [Collimonas pratensis]|uniref:terpene synthase family protein n=1 Tax=Collimonas pratensis TaxID=279113 RepID=UPI003C794D07
MLTFERPEFVLPFHAHTNPHQAIAGANARRWLLSSGLIGADQLAQAGNERYDELLAKMYPHAGVLELEVAICWLTWYFMLDDFLDKQDIHSARETVRSITGQIHGDTQARIEPDGMMAILWSAIWIRIAAAASPRSQQRFLLAQRDALLSNLQEIENRMERRIPDLFSFVALRRLSGGMRTVFLFNGYADHIELPAAFERHPLHMALSDAANDVACITNDILSFDKEAANGETNNYVIVVQHHMRGSIRQAVDFLHHLQAARIEAYLHAKKQLPQVFRQLHLPPAQQVRAIQYLRGVEDALSGLRDWSLQTPRYGGTAVAHRNQEQAISD